MFRIFGAGALSLGGITGGTQAGESVDQSAPESWPQARYNTTNTGFAPDNTGPEGGASIDWRTEVDISVTSSLVVASGLVYAGAGDLEVFDTQTGERRWDFDPDGWVNPSSVVGGTVYVGTELGVWALDAQSGDTRWFFETSGEVSAAPTVVDDRVYIGTVDNKVYALSAEDGTEQWQFQTGNNVRSPPAVDGQTVYVGCSFLNDHPNLFALNAVDGTERWHLTKNGQVLAPAIVDNTVYVTAGGTEVIAVDARDGTELWSVDANVEGPPAVAGDTVYVAGYDTLLYALRADTGEEAWSIDGPSAVPTAPVVVDDTVYLSQNQEFFAVGRDSEAVNWSVSVGEEIRSRPTVVDEEVFLGGAENILKMVEQSQTSESTPTETPAETRTVSRNTLPGVETQGPSDSTRATGTTTASADSDVPLPALSGALLIGASILGGTALYRRYRQTGDEEPGTTHKNTYVDEGDTTEASTDAETGNTPEDVRTDSPVAEFAGAVEEIRSVQPVTTTGQIHVYDGQLHTVPDPVRILALAPEHVDTEAVEKFTQLVDRWSSVSHNEYIAAVYASGAQPRPWAAVEAAETWLSDAVSEMELDTRLAHLNDVLEALNTASLYNVSHNSLSPETVGLSGPVENADVLVSDWGLSEALGPVGDDTSNTPYIAPEQLDGEASATTDIYLAGLLTYQLLTDHEPFADAADRESATRAGTLTPPSEMGDLPTGVDDLIATATATDPTDRYDSVTAFRDALDRVFD